jgi:hypothetical protein
MPKKVKRAELFFIASEPSGPLLRHAWRPLPLRKDGRAPWKRALKPWRGDLATEVVAALEEGNLLHLVQVAELPPEWNLILFEEAKWLEPAAVVTDELIEEYRLAVEYQQPLLFDDAALFGPFFWRLSSSDELLDDEHLRLEFLDAVDAERRRFERLRRQHGDGAVPMSQYRRERIPEDVRIFVWCRDEGKCVLCGSQENLEFDHVIPVSRGGGNGSRNIQLLCERCNRAKGAAV